LNFFLFILVPPHIALETESLTLPKKPFFSCFSYTGARFWTCITLYMLPMLSLKF